MQRFWLMGKLEQVKLTLFLEMKDRTKDISTSQFSMFLELSRKN